MGVLPLFVDIDDGPEYILLKDAIEEKQITITEVSQRGSVPTLKVVNKSPQFVLLLDGEALVGAKQNRVLNTSILVNGNSEIVIPVSCTEQGRWAYTSPVLSHADLIMSHRGRAGKAHGVTGSLHAGRGHTSDQRRVWTRIRGMHREAGSSSPTHSMHDVYTAKMKDLSMHMQAFQPVPQQRGSLVFINGDPVGLDIVSNETAYESLHSNLIKSYAIDAILLKKEDDGDPTIEKASSFLEEARGSEKSKFDAVDQGQEYRIEGASIVGYALVFKMSVIHLALFKFNRDEMTV